MFKSVIKEIIIMLLLCLAVVLVIGVVFYDYIPSQKTLPNKVAYEQSEEIKSELEEQIREETTINIVYELDAAELKYYNRMVDTGKQDPFAVEVVDITNSVDGNNTTIGNNTNSYLPSHEGEGQK